MSHITAIYTNSHGAGCVAQNITLEDAEKLLSGKGAAKGDVLLKDESGEKCGQRWKDGGKWNWWLDREAF